MPELTIYRKNSAPPPMICMYCGAPATATVEWREVNREPGAGATGGNSAPVSGPTGDDPISAVFAVVMLPFILWDLLKCLGAGIGAGVRYMTQPRPSPPPAPPKEQPTTRVVVTACDRHRRFRDRFVWAGLGTLIVLAALWVGAVTATVRVVGPENVGWAVALLITAVFASVVLPLALSAWYAIAGPVIADRVTPDTVVLDRVRQAYFDVTGLKPNGTECPPPRSARRRDRRRGR